MAEQREGQRLKYTVTHYRQPHLTHEEFMKWIVEAHLPIAMPVFKKHRVLSYTLLSTFPQAMASMQADPEGHASIKEQEKWVDTSRALVSVRYAIPNLLESGEVLDMEK
ncbi:hypothetical protein UA08_03902 [Talaromyces atroroseus]|uniref:EthD domain-containing protein n=1 Tax=Talaromyces atroroseus TaxID=1441469 RepID=A0A225B0R0_TALAT|nr:hypothetical protein UA08_03902 [Talaromyces atroroseus]OKL61559.1 hypothetical protein UA08_03902 [Talaromyces atroroseus]